MKREALVVMGMLLVSLLLLGGCASRQEES
jgi:predicted small secreted protein